VVLSREARPAPWRVVRWDGATLGPWVGELDGCDAVINLAGRSVNCRYNRENRREMIGSRVLSTRVVGEAIARAARPPRTWLQMSSATVYAHRFDAWNDEATGRLGTGEAESPRPWAFSVGIVRAWEDALASARVPHTRRVALRTSIVMRPERGGTFDVLLGLVRWGLGGTVGDGRQMVSWIHEDDFVRVVRWLLEHDEIDGVVNVTSPASLPNAEFMRLLRAAWGTPIGLPAASLVLAMGAWMLRTEPELVLKSRWSVPRRLLEHGFRFQWTRLGGRGGRSVPAMEAREGRADPVTEGGLTFAFAAPCARRLTARGTPARAARTRPPSRASGRGGAA
jgi:uncharacterized protein (TIGR01777 family)